MSVAVAQPVRQFRDHSLWAGAGMAASGLCQWGAVLALARFTDPASVGTYALANAITTPLFVFSHFGQRTLMVTGADRGASLAGHAWFRAATGAGAFAAALIAGAAFSPGLALTAMLAAVASLKLADSVLDASLGAFQREHRMDRAGFAQLWQAGASFGVFLVILIATRQAIPAVAGWAAARLAAAVWQVNANEEFDSRNGPRGSLDWRAALLPGGMGWPLAWAAALAIFTASVPRLLIEHYGGRELLGLFAAMSSVEMASGIVVSSLAQVAAPALAASARVADRSGFHALLTRLVVAAASVGGAAVLVALLAGSWILTILFGPAYAAAGPADAFAVLLGAAAVAQVNIALTVGLSARHLIHAQPYLLLLACLSALVAGLLLIPARGLEGAAWTSFTAAATHLAGILTLMWTAPWPPRSGR